MTWGEREERTPKGMEWLKEERPDFVRIKAKAPIKGLFFTLKVLVTPHAN